MAVSLGAFAVILDSCDLAEPHRRCGLPKAGSFGGSFATRYRDRVLLCHRTDMDWWNLPGGGVEKGELPTEAAIRETKEETGLEVEIESLTGVYGKSNPDEIIFVFRGRAIGGQLTVTAESRACQYFPRDRLPPNTIALHIERIDDAIAGRNQPIFRRQ